MTRRFLAPLAATLLLPAFAQAADPCDVAVNNACIDSDTFWPHAGTTRFVSIGGTEPLPRGQVSFGLVSSYQSRPVTLLTPSPGPTGTRSFAVDNQLTEHFLLALGITEKLHASFVLPATVLQNGEGLRPLTGGGTLRNQSLRDLRFGVGYAFVTRSVKGADGVARTTDDRTLVEHQKLSYGLMGRFDVSAPTGDRDSFSTNGTAVFVPTLAGDLRFGRLLVGAEIGARIRETREALGTRIGPQLTQALGVAYDVFGDELLAPFAELRTMVGTTRNRASVVRGSGVVDARSVGGGNAPAEWAVGVRTAPFFGGDFAADLSGGGGIALTGDDFGTPRFRFTLGLRYAPHERDSDGDGLQDKLDACPHEKEVIPAGSDAPHDGCVHEAPKAIDFDGTPAPAAAPALTPASEPMPHAPPGMSPR